MFFKGARLEVLNMIFHFVLCFGIIAGYVILRLNGVDDEAMKMSLIAAITFFFTGTANAISQNTIQKQNEQIRTQSLPPTTTTTATPQGATITTTAPTAAPTDNKHA